MINPVATHPPIQAPLENTLHAAVLSPTKSQLIVDQPEEAPVSVQISLVAEIKLLEKQGISVNNIALQLGLDTWTVSRYLT